MSEEPLHPRSIAISLSAYIYQRGMVTQWIVAVYGKFCAYF